ENCLSLQAVYNRVQKFSEGCSKVIDEQRSGRPVEIATVRIVLIWCKVDEIIRADGEQQQTDRNCNRVVTLFSYVMTHGR
ncbi:hypothetical protein AVEN_191958-1, partial [Araneus ventricosus]